MRAKAFIAGLFVCALACTHATDVRVDAASLTSEGGATYGTARIEGERGPSDRQGRPATPKVTADFKGPPPTNDWWSSLIWSFDGDPYSRPMFPHPLAVRADASGLGVGYPTEPAVESRGYRFPYAADLHLGVAGLHAPDARVAAASDWAVTARWADGAHKMDATFGHGLPFVYVRASDGASATARQAACAN
jgi:hypothetical protein